MSYIPTMIKWEMFFPPIFLNNKYGKKGEHKIFINSWLTIPMLKDIFRDVL